METKFLNFEKVEVVGATKVEALDKAPYFVQGDATQAFKNWKSKQTGAISERDIKQFCLDYLAKKSKNAPGIGFYITLETAIVDTRERPWAFHDTKNTKGKRKYVTTYQLVDKATGTVMAETNETKAKAKELAKELFKGGFKGTIVCTYTKQVVEGEPVAFEADYAPSKHTRNGRYLTFGIKA